jgi:hypothetical protein
MYKRCNELIPKWINEGGHGADINVTLCALPTALDHECVVH